MSKSGSGLNNEGVLRSLRRQHELQVLSTLAERGSCSRRELEKVTGLSRTTMSAIVADLLRRHAVLDDVQRHTGGRGRPTAYLRLNPRAASAVGLELGRGHVSVAVADVTRSVLVHTTAPVDADVDLAARLSSALGLLDSVSREHDLVLDGLAAVGLGLWGHHPEPGTAQHDPIDDLAVADVVARVEREFGTPVTWDNNIRLAAVAEARAVEVPPCTNLVYVVLSHGVGAGVVVDGTLARGMTGMAGELGHISVEPSGPPCWCGQRGCLEGYLSIDAVLASAHQAAQEVTDFSSLVDAVRRSDAAVVDVIAWSAELLGRALATITTLLDPHRIVIGGELADLGEPLIERVRAAVGRQKLSIRDRRIEVGTARISQGAAAVGAAMTALDEHASLRDLEEVVAPSD